MLFALTTPVVQNCRFWQQAGYCEKLQHRQVPLPRPIENLKNAEGTINGLRRWYAIESITPQCLIRIIGRNLPAIDPVSKRLLFVSENHDCNIASRTPKKFWYIHLWAFLEITAKRVRLNCCNFFGEPLTQFVVLFKPLSSLHTPTPSSLSNLQPKGVTP